MNKLGSALTLTFSDPTFSSLTLREDMSEALQVLKEMREDMEKLIEGFGYVEELLANQESGSSFFSRLSSSAAVIGAQGEEEDEEEYMDD